MLRSLPACLWNRVEITRPHNLAVAALSIAAGWVTAGGPGTDVRLLWAIVAGVLVAAAGNVINDVCDADIDSINKPRRPIPSGRLTRVQSLRYYVGLCVAALSASGAAGRQMFVAALIWTVALLAYSTSLKRRFLWGNLVVSLVCASGFIAGAWVAAEPVAGMTPAVLAFFFLMGREIVKDVEDLPGDAAHGARTLARALGARRALFVALAFFLGFAVLALAPYWVKLCGPPYLWMHLLGVLPLLFVATWLMLRDTSPANLLRVNWLLKLDMFVGVLAWCFGRTHP